jgi:hypothetical protein
MNVAFRFPLVRRVRAAVAAVAVILVTLSGHSAWSQTSRAIKVVVPFAAGGVADTLARLLAEQIGRAHGPTMVIEDRPGAGAVIGTEAVARAQYGVADFKCLRYQSAIARGELQCADQLRANLPGRSINRSGCLPANLAQRRVAVKTKSVCSAGSGAEVRRHDAS